MQRHAVAGLLVLLAVGVFAVGARASQPAFFECVKVATGGEYKESKCVTGEQHGKGHYELKEGIGETHAFKGFVTPMEITYPGSEEPEYLIDCGAKGPGQVRGELTSTTTIGHLEISEGACEQGCVNSPKGRDAFSPLTGTLGYLDAETGEVGIELTAEGGKPLAEFPCEGGQYIPGALIGRWGTDVNGFEQHALVGLYHGFTSFEGAEVGAPMLVTQTGELPLTIKRMTLTLIMPKGIQVRTH